MSAPTDERMIDDAHRHLVDKYGIEFAAGQVHRPRIWPHGDRRLHVAFRAKDEWQTGVTTTLHYDSNERTASLLRVEDDYWTKTLSRIFETAWRRLGETPDPEHLGLRVSEYAGYTSVPEYPFSAWAGLNADTVLAAHAGSLGFSLEFHAFPGPGSLPSRAEDFLCRLGDWASLRDLEGVDVTWFVYREALPAGKSPHQYLKDTQWSVPGPALASQRWRLSLQRGQLALGCEKTRALWRNAEQIDIL